MAASHVSWATNRYRICWLATWLYHDWFSFTLLHVCLRAREHNLLYVTFLPIWTNEKVAVGFRDLAGSLSPLAEKESGTHKGRLGRSMWLMQTPWMSLTSLDDIDVSRAGSTHVPCGGVCAVYPCDCLLSQSPLVPDHTLWYWSTSISQSVICISLSLWQDKETKPPRMLGDILDVCYCTHWQSLFLLAVKMPCYFKTFD